MSFPERNYGNSFVFPNTIVDGQIDISGTFYNRAGNVIIGDPNDNYSSIFPTIKCNEVQTQTLVNEQVSGSVNGFLIDNDPSLKILFLSSNGSFSDGLSIINGQGVTDLTLSTISTDSNIMTLSTSAIRPEAVFTGDMYITSGNKLLFYDINSISADQGVQFTLSSTSTTINDFVSELSENEVSLVNTTDLDISVGTKHTGYINQTDSSYYLITKDTLSDGNFLDGDGITDISNNPLKVSPITGEQNRYLISSKSDNYNIEHDLGYSHRGFNDNNKFFLLDATYNLTTDDFVEPYDGYDLSGTTITLSGTHYYEYSADKTFTVTDSAKFLTNKEGIYVSYNFYLFDGFTNSVGESGEQISSGDGVFIRDISYGFLDAVNDEYSTFSKTNLQDNTSSQILGYISSDSKLVTNASIDDIGGTIIVNSSYPTDGISKIGSSDPSNNRVFDLSHNDVGTIKETSPSFTKKGYLFDETTLVLTDKDFLGTKFFFEIEDVSVFGLHSSTNDYYNTITNSSSSSIATTKDSGTFEGAVINDNGTYIYAHGKSPDASLNDIIYNSSFVGASSVGIIDSDSNTDRSNTYIIDYKGIEPSESTKTTVDAFFIDGKIYLSSDVSDNDIIGTATNGYDMVGSCLTQQTYYVDLDYYPSSRQSYLRTGGKYFVNSSNTIYVETNDQFKDSVQYINYIAVYDSGNIFDRIITDTTTTIDGTKYHVFTMATTIPDESLELEAEDLQIFKIQSTSSMDGTKYGNRGWSTNPNSNVLIIESIFTSYLLDLVGAVLFRKQSYEFLGFVQGQTYDNNNRTLTLTMSRTFTSNLYDGNEVFVHLNKDTEINIHSPVSFDVYTPIDIDIYQGNIDLYDSQNYNFYKTVENKSYAPRSFNEYDKISCAIYENLKYEATTKTNINFPPLVSEDTIVMTDFAQTLTNKHFSGNVGIGTTSPTEVLEISGNVFVRGTQKIRDDALTLPSQGTASYTYSSNMKIDFLSNINSYYFDGTGSSWNVLNGGMFYTGASIHYVPAAYLEVGSSNAGTHGKLHFKVQGMNTSNTTTEIERMTITSNGNVGIGTTTPTEALDVNGNIILPHNGTIKSSTGTMRLESEYDLKIKSDWNGNNYNPNYGQGVPSADIIFYTSSSERMRIKRETGNVGIGTDNPSQKLHVAGNIQTTSGVYFINHGTNYLSNGNGDGASLTTGNVTFRSWWGIRFLDYTNTCRSFISTRSGTWYGGTASTSDDRCKREEVYIQDALNTILKLKPQNYKKYFNLDCSGQYQYESGLIAQEVYYDTPELQHLIKLPEDADLSGNPIPTSDDPQVDPDYSIWGSTPASVNYIGLIPYLIKAVQEQQEVIETEKTKNTTLETQITSILARLDILENS